MRKRVTSGQPFTTGPYSAQGCTNSADRTVASVMGVSPLARATRHPITRRVESPRALYQKGPGRRGSRRPYHASAARRWGSDRVRGVEGSRHLDGPRVVRLVRLVRLRDENIDVDDQHDGVGAWLVGVRSS